MCTISNQEDLDLVKSYLKGCNSSFEILINRHRKKIYSYIYLTVKNTTLAEDIFQDTFIKIIKSLREGRYRDDGKFTAWAMRIAHNLIIDHYRKEKQLNVINHDSFDNNIINFIKQSDDCIEDILVQEQMIKELRQSVYSLPEEQKQIIILRHYCDMSFKEISEITNVGINTALGRMRYALINLRKIMEEKMASV